MASALSGVRVLDVTGNGPAALAAGMLGDMGADVIKIDLPPGAGPRGVGDGIEYLPQDRLEAEKMAANTSPGRNKKNMAINLRIKAGQDVFHRLVKASDVIIEGFRPGVMDRMNVGYKDVAKTNPRIVYCAVSGYGQTGPYSNLPGHDGNYVSMAGIQGLIGRRLDEAPVFALNLVADMGVAYLQAVIGILLALHARERTGRGQMVDISMTDGSMAFLAGIPQVTDYFYSGAALRRGQSVLSGNQPYYHIYRTRDDKWLTLCPLEPKFWANMCRALDRPQFIPHEFDAARADEMLAELQRIFLTKTRDEWFDLLAKADVAVAKVLDIDELFSDPQVLHRQMVMELEHPKFGKVRQLGFPIKLSDTPGTVRRFGGLLGQDTSEVMADEGYSVNEIADLRRQGAIY